MRNILRCLAPVSATILLPTAFYGDSILWVGWECEWEGMGSSGTDLADAAAFARECRCPLQHTRVPICSVEGLNCGGLHTNVVFLDPMFYMFRFLFSYPRLNKRKTETQNALKSAGNWCSLERLMFSVTIL